MLRSKQVIVLFAAVGSVSKGDGYGVSGGLWGEISEVGKSQNSPLSRRLCCACGARVRVRLSRAFGAAAMSTWVCSLHPLRTSIALVCVRADVTTPMCVLQVSAAAIGFVRPFDCRDSLSAAQLEILLQPSQCTPQDHAAHARFMPMSDCARLCPYAC